MKIYFVTSNFGTNTNPSRLKTDLRITQIAF